MDAMIFSRFGHQFGLNVNVHFMYLYLASSVIDLNLLQADCVNLLIKYYKEARRAIYLSSLEQETRGKREENSNMSTQEMEKIPTSRTIELKSRTRSDARCCLCFDPFSIQNLDVVVFFCCHAYHFSCLSGGSDYIDVEGDPTYGDEDGDEGGQSGGSQLRCVLCTTAGG